ncbi:MAG: TetR/AcrR family transcriptional regulator [Solirubrobacteraceae bacterium]
MTDPAPDHRRATAERNVEAILDAAAALLQERAQASIAAVAQRAGVSRVTVYAHFATREVLLEAVVERAATRSTAAIDAAEPERGDPVEALERVVGAAWSEVDRQSAIAAAAAEQLSPTALARSHETLHRRLVALVERGRDAGTFRSDLDAHWLVTSWIALTHACAQEVRAGRLDADAAGGILTVTVRDLLVAPGGPARTPRARSSR